MNINDKLVLKLQENDRIIKNENIENIILNSIEIPDVEWKNVNFII